MPVIWAPAVPSRYKVLDTVKLDGLALTRRRWQCKSQLSANRLRHDGREIHHESYPLMFLLGTPVSCHVRSCGKLCEYNGEIRI